MEIILGLAVLIIGGILVKITKRLDEIIQRQNEIEENILQEVRDYGVERDDFETPEDVAEFVAKTKSNQSI